jgi:hypothetical protein
MSERDDRANAKPAADIASQPAASDVLPSADLARALQGFQGRWVAVQHNDVLTNKDSFSDVVAWLRANQIEADGVFKVPEDPTRLLEGYHA